MKKLISLVIAAAMTVTMFGCGKEKAPTPPAPVEKSTPAPETPATPAPDAPAAPEGKAP